MVDLRKKIIINMSEVHLGTTFPGEDWDKDIIGMQELEDFIESNNHLTLFAIIEEKNDNKRLKFFKNATDEDENFQVVAMFCKPKPAILTEENLRSSIHVSSFSGSPVLALYNALTNGFMPLLAKEKEIDINKHLVNIQADLKSSIYAKEDFINNSSSLSLSVINSLEEEMEFWIVASSMKKDRLSKTTAASFRDILKPVVRDFSVFEALSLNDAEDVLERVHNILDDLWRHEPPYPKDRVKHIFDLIANEIIAYCSVKLKGTDLWQGEYNVVTDLLLQHSSLGDKWITTCKQLTEIFWPNYPSNPWKDGVYIPKNLTQYNQKLSEIQSIRTLHKQLIRLLTPEEQLHLKTNELFEPFKSLDILANSQRASITFLKAQKQFEYLLQPAEKSVAMKLKKHLSTVNANTRQLLYEFSRYSELISRPVLKQTLQSERQFLLTSLFDYVRQLQYQSSSESYLISSRFDTPQVVKDIIQVRQVESKVNEIDGVSRKLLDDLHGFDNLLEVVEEFAKNLKHQHNELFESWSSEMVARINDGTLSLKETDPVVQFSKSKLMKVNYNPRLVTLIAEVRQLRAMGYHVPNLIEETSLHAKEFMKYARILEQIANFHNTIGDRMLSSQKPMMLVSALELSKLVQEQEVVSWEKEKSVEKYVEVLKTAVEKLSKENSFLSNHHHQIMNKMKELEDVDLIKEYSKWKEISKFIRGIVTQIEDKGFKNTQNWKNELDNKLAELLEKQYLKSLETLHLYLPEIYTDLVYRNSKLEFAPDEGALMKQYNAQLKRFLDIPKNFKGVSDSSDQNVFSSIINKNEESLGKVKKHTEELFEQLEGVKKYWQSWLQLEPIDSSKLQTWEHWDLHFRASKTFGQEIAKLPSSEERVGCFLVGLSRLRSDLESHNRSHWDQLVYSLKDSIAQDVVKLQNYIDPSTAALTKQPVTVDEVGESNSMHANIMKQASEMEEVFNQMMKKNEILASWSREQVDSVNRLRGAWDRLQSLLENHQHIIARQMETIKVTLNIDKENFEKELERFAAKWEQIKPKNYSGQILNSTFEDLEKQFNNINSQKEEWTEITSKKNKLEENFEKFGFGSPEINNFDIIIKDIEEEESRWKLFESFNTELNEIRLEFWIVFRKKTYLFEDFLTKWKNDLGKMEVDDMTTRLLREIQKYELVAPLLKYLRGDDFSEKHWMDVYNLLGIDFKPVDHLIVGDFLKVHDRIEENVKQFQIICKRAASEIIVRQALGELEQWDVQARFQLAPHADSKNRNIMLVKDYKDILNKIGDNQSLLQSVKNSADYESFAEKAQIWETKLTDLDYFLTTLSHIQRKWIYLEPIFASGTLNQEKSRFDKIDRDFQNILKYIDKDSRVGALCRFPNLRSLLDTITDQLARCQNSLDNFLQEKRNKFPRFLFLSDDDLLEVVGQSSKEQVIQNHLKKLFSGINSIELDQDGSNIISMCSAQGETVKLSNPINIKKPVEEWLNALVKEMQLTLKELLVLCQSEKQAPDPLKYPSQILCLADSISFTNKVEQAIGSMTLPPLLAKYKTQLSYYSSLELNANDTEQSLVLELKLKSLLLDTIHHINVLEELLDSNTVKVGDWSWQKQLRYYSNSTGEVTVKMANARIEYSFEYLGNASKLVRTPLTERCFLTLTQGMHLGMGGNPYGPAGTGKTESVKALGQLLGRQVLVFNCDEGIDSSSMARILSGLVRSGAWGCFDEFNRLDEATLSAISMIIQPIQTALRTNQTTVYLLNSEVTVNKHCGIFVTLNPAGGSYGGRNKLPDNLKQLFRPVVMTHPDHEEIARSLLHCDGFQNADLLAKKIIEVFSISSNLLTKQQHYDWGLRAIRTILIGCGRAMKALKVEEKSNLTLDKELETVVKVLRVDVLSKLTFNDSVKFDSIIRDVFKGVALGAFGNDILSKALEESFEELGLIFNEKQVYKSLELFEQLKQRMGVAIVGPPGSGKTAIRKILLQGLLKLKKTIKQHSVNPKSMNRTQLLGQLDPDTKQWNDGVLTNFSLQVISQPREVWSWIVCDGDIDPDWIESLNSVLDDNRLMTLPSGWRIQFGDNVNFIFESHDLKYASPATISRLGIVFLSEEDLDVKLYIKSFSDHLPEDSKAIIEPLIDEYFLPSLKWILRDGEVAIETSKIGLIKTGLSQIVDVKTKSQFAVNLVNGFGQLLLYDFREPFNQQVFEWMGEILPAMPLSCRYNRDTDSVDSYVTNPNYELNGNEGVYLVPTAHVKQSLDVLRNWLDQNNQNFLLIGPHGSAKSSILKKLVSERTDMEMISISCTSSLKPSFVINKLTQHCLSVNTHRGKVYKPKKGYLVLHFKNLHLLQLDKWGTNILIEFLLQLIVYKGFFDSNIEFVGVDNLIITGSMTIDNNVSRRFLSNIHYYNINIPEQEDLIVILSCYLTMVLEKTFPQSLPKAKIMKLVGSLLQIYDKAKIALNSIEFKHYSFNPHDLTTICSNILRYQLEEEDFESQVLEVICNEVMGIFEERLASDTDREKLVSIINETFQMQWGKAKILKFLDSFYYVPSSQHSGGYNDLALNKLTREDWKTMVELGILQNEREGHILDLIVTKELLDLTASIAKSLSAQGSNLILIGRTGVGRRNAVKIVASLLSSKLIQLQCDNSVQFNNDLKNALQWAGIDGEHVYLLVDDQILMNNDKLDIINVLISCGEVPGLYNQLELETLVKNLKEDLERENFEGDLIQFFFERVKQKLHVIICLDVKNQNLFDIFQSSSALIQYCHVIWRSEWSDNTLQTIPKIIIDKVNEESKNSHVEYTDDFYKIYTIAKDLDSAQCRYINMIKLYIKIYKEKIQFINGKKDKLQAGVDKLTEAGRLVNDLKQEAAKQKEKLAEKQSKANQALDMISNTMKNANSHKEEMEVLKQKTENENVQLMQRKKEIEAELAEVEPLIQQARAAVGNIKSESLSEIRSLRAPPEIIRDILEGVLRLMGIQDTSWNSMKTFLAKRGVKEEIKSFDASRITTENRQAVERLMSMKSDSFDPKSAKRASVAAAPLAAWVLANVKYSHVSDKIKPLEREQNKLKKNLNEAQDQLGELSAGLLDVDATVAKLKEQLNVYTKEAAEVEIGLNKAQNMLQSAEGLVLKLKDEYDRWQIQLKELSSEIEKMPKFCLIAAATIMYLSKESEYHRKETMAKWTEAVGIEKFSFEEFLSSEREQLQWSSEGLSSDTLSIQNAIIIKNANIVPLMIDPTSNAISWLRQHFKNRNLDLTTQNSPKLTTMLELAVRFGKTFIIEEVDQIPQVVLSLLRNDFLMQGERKLIRLNGKLMDYHQDFKLILCCRNEQLKLTSDVSALVNVMNFSVTPAGLTEQLLLAAISQENPELEERRKQLLRRKEELQEKEFQLQNQLLEDLATSTGDILENKKLLASLNETKASASEITASLIESREIQNKIQQEYETFREISSYGSALYFACNEFAACNVLYLISVSAFTQLFLQSLQTFQHIQEKIDAQKKNLLATVYNYMSRGIFKDDRVKFLLHLIYKLSDLVKKEEWELFIGSIVTRASPEGLPHWVPKQNSFAIANLLSLSNLEEKLFLNEGQIWNSFMNSPSCEKEFPSQCRITDFQKLLVIQALRPDRLYSAMGQYISHVTGITNLDPALLDFAQLLKETENKIPILILTVSGRDPSLEIKELARIQNYAFSEIAMGEGQENNALATLQKCSQSGEWLILKNLHLVTSWLPILTQTFKTLESHEKFRLWLISEPSQKFNFVLAQNSLKIVFEPPEGIKNNLQRTYMTFGATYFEKLNPTAARIFFVVSCLHALLQERRKYIPQGWSRWYEFSETDLSTFIKLIEDLWQNQSHQIQWKFISGLCCNAVYGGRIENVDDMTILESYTKHYFNDEVLSHRWKLFDLNLNIPSSSKFQEYLSTIQQVPSKDSPHYFGLPENIDKAWEKQFSIKIINELKNLHLTKHTNNGFDRETFHKGLAPFINLWKRLNQGQDFVRMICTDLKFNEGNIVDTFILEEFNRGLGFVQAIHKNFANLNRICKGLIAPDETNLKIGFSLLNFETPKAWLNLWNGPKDPDQFLRAVINKMTNLLQWKDELSGILNKPIKLSSLFYPQALLASHKQQFSKDNDIPMDQLMLQTSWNRTGTKPLALTDLLIEGGQFQGTALTISSSKSEGITAAPDCYLNWVNKKTATEDYLNIPLYISSKREVELMTIQMECNDKDKDMWILAGLAFYLEY